jgi:hypothetical protein
MRFDQCLCGSDRYDMRERRVITGDARGFDFVALGMGIYSAIFKGCRKIPSIRWQALIDPCRIPAAVSELDASPFPKYQFAVEKTALKTEAGLRIPSGRYPDQFSSEKPSIQGVGTGPQHHD